MYPGRQADTKRTPRYDIATCAENLVIIAPTTTFRGARRSG